MLSREFDRIECVRLYTVEHLTMQRIADQMFVTKPTISNWLKKAGIDTKQGTWATVKCFHCGAELKVLRSRLRRRNYCNTQHYLDHRKHTTYHGWRQGQRRARAVVTKHFTLEPQMVVHHEDRDNRNNDPSNLVVFANQSDHLKYHHGQAVTPLWRGDTQLTAES